MPSIRNFERSTKVFLNNTKCNFTASYLSPEEIIITMQREVKQGFHKIVIQTEKGVKFERPLRVVNESLLDISLISLKRFIRLPNGSIAISINDNLAFRSYISKTFQLLSIETMNRLHFPFNCPWKVSCVSEDMTPEIKIESRSFEILFTERGMYTVIVYLKSGRTRYRYTVKTENYIIVQEKIVRSCITISDEDRFREPNGVRFAVLQADAFGLKFSLDLDYHWDIRGSGLIGKKVWSARLSKTCYVTFL